MDLETLREYIRIHAISLEEDLNNEDGADSVDEARYLAHLEGAIHVSKHYLEVLASYDD